MLRIRPFSLDDLDGAARFCAAAREVDASIEPFGEGLEPLMNGRRAELALWRIAEDDQRNVQGIAFAAARDASLFDIYVAVHPAWRRNGVGRTLSAPAIGCGAALRARVDDDAEAGRSFLRRLGFLESGAELSLRWTGRAGMPAPLPGFAIRRAAGRDRLALRELSQRGWAGSADAYSARSGDIAQLLAPGRIALVAESGGRACGFLGAAPLGDALAIEELAVMPEFRRRGIARALLGSALQGRACAVLAVAERNVPARALYRSFGFRQASRRIVFARR